MHAFPAAKRTAYRTALLGVLSLVIALSAPLAQASEDSPGYLGVMLQDIGPSMAKALQLENDSGIIINEVIDDSPAAQAGLESGDVILKFQGNTVTDYQDFTRMVRKSSPGEKVSLVLLRDGKQKKLKVELGEREETNTWFDADDNQMFLFEGDDGQEMHFKALKNLHEDMDMDDVHVEILKNLHEGDEDGPRVIIKKMLDGEHGDVAFFGQDDRGFMGVSLGEIEGQMADYFEVDGGALVTEVHEDTPAAKAGLKAGDIIVKVGDQDVDSPDALHEAMAGTKADQEVDIKVVRKGKKKTMKVTLGEMPEDMAMKNIQVFSDDDQFTVTAPKMLFHGKDKHFPGTQYRVMRTAPHGGDEELEWVHENPDLDQLKDDLKELKKELKQLKKELREK